MHEMAEMISKICFVIFRLFLSFLHLVYSGIEYFHAAWLFVKRKLSVVLLKTDPQTYVSQFVAGLRKCPKHLAIISGEEGIGYEDYLNLVLWCLAADITYISFYDYTGYMKEKEDLYNSYLLGAGKLDPNSVIFLKKRRRSRNGLYKNGYSKKVHINILSLDDGRRLFSKLVGILCEKALFYQIITEEIDEKFLDDEIRSIVGATEPELAIIGGRVCSTFGFLPWQIRLTEFLQVPSIRNISVTDFTSALERYSSCQQRFGC